jgi:hypothetical protein
MPLIRLTATVGVRATALRHAHDELTLTGAAGLEHRDLDGLACCLKISSDVEQVLSGAGHWFVSYVASVQGQGEGGQAPITRSAI